MNGQTRQTASPWAKAKVKARARENIQEKGTTTRTRLELRMKMDSARWVILVQNVKELNLSVTSKRMMDDFETPRLDRAAHVFCVQKCKSAAMDSKELPSSLKRVFDGSKEPAGTHANFDQSKGEVLFAVGCRDDRPTVGSGGVVSTCTMDYATSIPTEKVHYNMNSESFLCESLQHYGIKRDVLSPTELAGP